MVFWFWVLVTVLATPAVAYGLGMATLYLYCRYRGIVLPELAKPRQDRPRDGGSMWWGLW